MRQWRKSPQLRWSFLQKRSSVTSVYVLRCGAASKKTETGKIMMAILGVMTFVTSGYEHSVANMTFFTIGLLDPGTAITIGGVLYNLLIVTAGNMLGGILFVALPYYLIQKKD